MWKWFFFMLMFIPGLLVAEDETIDLCYKSKHQKRDKTIHNSNEYHCHRYTRLWKDCEWFALDESNCRYWYWKETSVYYPETDKRVYLK